MNITPYREIQNGVLFEEAYIIQELAEDVINITDMDNESIKDTIYSNIIEMDNIKDKIEEILTAMIIDNDPTTIVKTVANLIHTYHEIHIEMKTEYVWSYTKETILNKHLEGQYFQGVIRAKDINEAQEILPKITETEDWNTPWEINPVTPLHGYIRRKEHNKMPKLYPFSAHTTLKEI